MSDSEARIPTGAEASNQVSATETGNLSVAKSEHGGWKVYTSADALQDIEASGLRGNAVMIALGPLIKLLQNQLHVSEERAKQLEQRLVDLQTKHNAQSELVAVLRCQLENVGRMKLLQNILLSAGGIFNGLAAKDLIEGKNAGFGLLAFGVVLMFSGWLWPLGPKSNQVPK